MILTNHDINFDVKAGGGDYSALPKRRVSFIYGKERCDFHGAVVMIDGDFEALRRSTQYDAFISPPGLIIV